MSTNTVSGSDGAEVREESDWWRWGKKGKEVREERGSWVVVVVGNYCGVADSEVSMASHVLLPLMDMYMLIMDVMNVVGYCFSGQVRPELADQLWLKPGRS